MECKPWKITQQNFKSSNCYGKKFKNKIKKSIENKEIKIKTMGTRFDIKIIWNQTLLDEGVFKP